jgi:hypothetical protein
VNRIAAFGVVGSRKLDELALVGARRLVVVEQLPLHLSIAFFVSQVAAWAGLGGYLYLGHRRRSKAPLSRTDSNLTSHLS